MIEKPGKLSLNSQRSSHTHWLAAQSLPRAKASQRVCLPSLGKKFSKMPHARQKKDKGMTRTDKHEIHNRLTLWI